MRGTTSGSCRRSVLRRDFNPRPPVRGTTKSRASTSCRYIISIHVPLCGGRRLFTARKAEDIQFQSTSPCAGDDASLLCLSCLAALFQSTSPCAGDDLRVFTLRRYYVNFNPRPPVRGTTFGNLYKLLRDSISIHVPLCGGRRCVVWWYHW